MVADEKAMEQMDVGNKEKWVKHYSSKHQILLVGEGDFSFSWCLARSFGCPSNIVASSLDPFDDVIQKYKKAKSNMKHLVKLGACVLHGVDVTKMKNHFALRMQKFDRIIYNFPHAGFHGKEDSDHVIEKHKELVGNFFGNANYMLQADGEVHIAHKTTPPFCDRNILELARRNSLEIIERTDFKIEDYPGYCNKRGDGDRCDEPFPLGECSTFKFRSFLAATKIYAVTANPGSTLKRSRQLPDNPIQKHQRITFDRGFPLKSFSMNSKDFSDYTLTPLEVNFRMEAGASTSLQTCGGAITRWSNPVHEKSQPNRARYMVKSSRSFVHESPYLLHALQRMNQPFNNWDSQSHQREMVRKYGQDPKETWGFV